MTELEPPLRLILNTCHDLIANKSLQDFMAVILQLGNYLNSVYLFFFLQCWFLSRSTIHFIMYSIEQLCGKCRRIQVKRSTAANGFASQQAAYDPSALYCRYFYEWKSDSVGFYHSVSLCQRSAKTESRNNCNRTSRMEIKGGPAPEAAFELWSWCCYFDGRFVTYKSILDFSLITNSCCCFFQIFS